MRAMATQRRWGSTSVASPLGARQSIWSVVDSREFADLRETDTVVHCSGRQVVAIDIERHSGHQLAGELHDSGHGGSGQAAPPQLGLEPDALHLANRAVDRPEVGFEEHPITVEEPERPSRGDQLPHIEPVASRIALDGRHTDFLGVHPYRGIVIGVPVLERDPADLRIRSYLWILADRQ